MTWIKTIEYREASGKLKRLYDRIIGPKGYLDNILKIHSLRPNTLEGHMSIYKNVLHHSNNTLPKWLLEALGVYVSHLNQCDYCFDHHFEGMKKLLNNNSKAQEIRQAMISGSLDSVFNSEKLVLFEYAKILTINPGGLNVGIINNIKAQGYDDGQVLEVNQVISYFSYANRTVSGLGVTTKGDTLGLSPGDENSKNWHHQ